MAYMALEITAMQCKIAYLDENVAKAKAKTTLT